MIKRLLFFLFLFVFSFSVFSQHNRDRAASLNVFSEQSPFYLYINDVLYNTNPQYTIRIDDLPNKLFNVRVVYERGQGQSASLPSLAVYNELNQALEVTLFANNKGLNRNKLIVFSMFPKHEFGPESHDYISYTFGRPEQSINPPNDPYYGLLKINDVEFQDLLKRVKGESFDDNKLKLVSVVMPNYLFSLQQVKQLMASFSWDKGKLSLAEMMYSHCYNPSNYLSLIDLFSFQDAKDKLLNFISAQSEDMLLRPKRMQDGEFAEFLKTLKKQSFDDNKVNVIEASKNNVSFSVSQINAILKLFSFDKGKLAVAKMLYANCWDRMNYYTLTDSLTFSSAKTELLDFIKNNSR